MRFDYIIVGSGSGGAAVTRRLVDAGASVALIEAGPAGFGVAELVDPTAWVPLAKTRWDWGHDYAPTPRILDRIVPIPRGKVLGGSGTTNAMMWYRGNPADYDRWDAVAKGWSFADCLPAFKACEDWEEGETDLRGTGGPLKITRSPDLHPVAQAMIDAAGEKGVPVIADANGPSNHGAAPSNFNIVNGRRFTPADGYLGPILNAPNLTLFCESRVLRLELQGDRITGVTHTFGGREMTSYAEKGVILAAGAFETPRILTLSGIAAEADLQRLGIKARLVAQGIGENLQDHPLCRALNAYAKAPIPAPRDNGGGSIMNWKSDATLDQPDLHAFPVCNRSGSPAVIEKYALGDGLFAIGTGLMRSHSKGYIKVLSTDIDAPMEIQPNFLADARDLAALCIGVEFVQDMLESAAFADLFGGHAGPDKRLSGKETEDFVRLSCSTFFHPCGTVRMGDDADAPVTARLQLRGVEGLWIADASVIPEIPTCNTHAPVTMIGERAAQFILEDA